MTSKMLQVRTPKGNQVGVGVRADTSDEVHAVGVILNDEYRLRELPDLDGWALDIGSYAGHVALALVADHPNLRVLAVDPVPENIALLQEAIDAQALTHRVYPLQAAAGDAEGLVTCRYNYSGAITHATGATTDESYVHQNRFMAGLWRQEPVPGTDVLVPAVTLRGLAVTYEVEQFALCKIDCEGCEYAFLADGAELVRIIVGEYHDGGPERIIDLLTPTHNVEVLEDHGGTGIFRAFIR